MSVLTKQLKSSSAAKYLDVTTRTLLSWRNKGTGPRHTTNAEGHHLYEIKDLDLWISQQEADVLTYRATVKRGAVNG